MLAISGSIERSVADVKSDMKMSLPQIVCKDGFLYSTVAETMLDFSDGSDKCDSMEFVLNDDV